MSNKKKWRKYKKETKLKKYQKDSIYNSMWLNKFLKIFTKKGLKFRSEVMIYKIFYNFKKIIHPLRNYFYITHNTKWIFTTCLKRMGKYYHSIPTYLRWPKSYSHGLRKLFRITDSITFSNNYICNVFYELFNLKFYPYKSFYLKIKKKRFELIEQNKAYSHFRWR